MAWQLEIYGRMCEDYLLANDLEIAEAVSAQMVSTTGHCVCARVRACVRGGVGGDA